MTKAQLLQRHLIEGKPINKFDAYRLWGIEALPTAISRLSRTGMEIQQRSVIALNKMDKKVMCNEYFLKVKQGEREWVKQDLI
jgi:hypothetical protein